MLKIHNREWKRHACRGIAMTAEEHHGSLELCSQSKFFFSVTLWCGWERGFGGSFSPKVILLSSIARIRVKNILVLPECGYTERRALGRLEGLCPHVSD